MRKQHLFIKKASTIVLTLVMFISMGSISVAAETVVNNVAELESSFKKGGDIKLGANFQAREATLRQWTVFPGAVTIDGSGVVWDQGTLHIIGEQTRDVTIRNIVFDGSDDDRDLLSTDWRFIKGLTLDNVIFRNTSQNAILNGSPTAGLTIMNSKFENIGENGIVYTSSAVKSSQLAISDTSFINDASIVKNGSAISIPEMSAPIKIDNVLFENQIADKATINGGVALNLTTFRNQLSINNSYFKNNELNNMDNLDGYAYGGAIYIDTGQFIGMNIRIQGTTFEGNSVSGYGGAIRFDSNFTRQELTLSDNTFFNNHASMEGAAMSIKRSKNSGFDEYLSIDGSTFVDNNVQSRGNSVDPNTAVVIEMGGCRINNMNNSLVANNYITLSDGTTVYDGITNVHLDEAKKDELLKKNIGLISTGLEGETILGTDTPNVYSNGSSITAGYQGEVIVPTIPTRPAGLAYDVEQSITRPGHDQRGVARFNNYGATESSYIRIGSDSYSMNTEGLTEYDGTVYIDNQNLKSAGTYYYLVGVSGDQVSIPGEDEIQYNNLVNQKFVGWTSTEGSHSIDYNPGDTLKFGTEPITLYPVIEDMDTYSVTYTDGVNGEIFEDVHHDVVVGALRPDFGILPEREGYDFVGWDPELEDTVTHDLVYTAQWKLKEFTIEYRDEDQSVLETFITNWNEDTPRIEAPNKPGKVFKGWNPQIEDKVYESSIYTAVYEDIIYDIVYHDEDGSILESFTALYGEDTPKPIQVPSKIGYTFNAWDQDNSIKVYESADYYPTWEINTYTITYQDGYQGIHEIFTADYDSKTPIPEIQPSRTGYTFTGWHPEVLELVDGDMIYTASWTKNSSNTPEDGSGSNNNGSNSDSDKPVIDVPGTDHTDPNQGANAGSNNGSNTLPETGVSNTSILVSILITLVGFTLLTLNTIKHRKTY